MGTVKVVDVIRTAQVIYNDVLKLRVTDAELLDWYNDAVLELVNKRPDALVKTASFNCALGTLQTLPSDGLRFIKVVRNDGLSKLVVNPIDVDVLNEICPDWHDDAAPVSAAEHYVYDNRDPKHFYLYPAVADGHSVVLSYTLVPAKVAINDFSMDEQVIELDDAYKSPLVDWLLYRVFSKDIENAANFSRADKHYRAFYQSLGIKLEGDTGISVNSKSE